MEMKPVTFLLIPVIVVLLADSQQTAAQYRDSLGTPWNNPLSATMSTMIWNKINEATMYGPQRARSSGTSRRATSTAARPEVVPA